ncbi:hypothetical protein [Streptomyces sp. NPDC003943]
MLLIHLDDAHSETLHPPLLEVGAPEVTRRGRFAPLGALSEGERPASAVRGEVDLRSQAAAGPSEGMIVRLAGRDPF